MGRNLHQYLSRSADYSGRSLGLVLVFLFAVVGASGAANSGLLPNWQAPRVIKNIVISTGDSRIYNTVQMGNKLYFISTAGLMRSDGTPTGTILLEAGHESHTNQLMPLGDRLVMIPAVGYPPQIWVTDGTPGNAHPILDDDLVESLWDVKQFTVAGPYLYFIATFNDKYDPQLWRTDGTPTGTMRLTGSDRPLDLNNPRLLAGLDGMLYFFATIDGASTVDLMKSGGTPEDTTVVKAIANASNIDARHVGNLDGSLYFNFYSYDDDSAAAKGIWRSDGTEGGTSLLIPMDEWNSYVYMDEGVVVGDSVIYMVTQRWIGENHDVPVLFLWQIKANGATTNIALPFGMGYSLVAAGDRAFFTVGTPETGAELWTSDGTAAGTKLVKDLYPGSNDGYQGGLIAVGNQVYFAGSAGTVTKGLWRSNGTAAGTVEVPLNPGGYLSASPEPIYDFDGRLFFTALDFDHGREPWITNLAGTQATFLKDINDQDSAGSYPRMLNYANNRLFFTAFGGLWVSDGRESGTKLIFENQSTPYEHYVMSDYEKFQTTDNLLFFHVQDYSGSQPGRTELWRSDGTVAGTFRVLGDRDMKNRPAQSMADVDGTLYFTLNNFHDRHDLWRSNGKPDGTYRVATPNLTDRPSRIDQITGVGSVAYFVADDGIHGLELWRSDGTKTGTYMVKDTVPGLADSNATKLTAFNGRLFFVLDDGVHGTELWRSDGTAAGTYMVKDIKAGPEGSEPEQLTVFNNRLYFTAKDGIHGRELWKSDGTSAGTAILKDILPGGSTNPLELTPGRDWLYFVASDDETVYQPWKTDGTAEGTQRIANLNYNEFAWPRDLVAVGNTLFFTTMLSTSERLYRSDGTAAGTIAFQDAFPDFPLYDFVDLTAAPGRLFSSATSLLIGNEPFVFIADPARHIPDALYLADGGNFTTYKLKLNFQPSAPVTIAFTSDDPSVELLTQSVTISPQNWDTPAPIVVSVQDDGNDGEIREAVIIEEFTSADEQYNGVVLEMTLSIGWRLAYAPVVIR